MLWSKVGKVCRDALIGLAHHDAIDPDAIRTDAGLKLLGHKLGDVFCGGIDLVPRLDLVEKHVLPRLNQRAQLSRKKRKIEHKSSLIERVGANKRTHAPVVSMQPLTFTFGVAKLMGGTKHSFVLNLPAHKGCSVRTGTTIVQVQKQRDPTVAVRRARLSGSALWQQLDDHRAGERRKGRKSNKLVERTKRSRDIASGVVNAKCLRICT